MASETHPAVVEYYLAILIKLFGSFDEPTFRLLFAIFPILAILSFYRIARRFTAHPFLVSCLFAVSPAFLVLSPTLMMDIPMLAFLLAGLSVHFGALDTGKRLWLSSTCFALAAGTGYTALVPVACLFVWTVINRRPMREWIAIAAVPAVVFIWHGILRFHFGEWPASELIKYYTSHFSFDQLVFPMLSFIGGISIFPWTYLVFMERPTVRHLVPLSTLSALVLTLFHPWPSIFYRLWWVVLASSGIGLLVLFAVKSTRPIRRDKPLAYGFLIIWLPGVLLFLLLFSEMISARYLLLGLPPLFLIVFDRIRPAPAVYAIAATAMLSGALAVADYRLVNSYPRWVLHNIVPLQRQGFRVWNSGESGLRFYLEEEGIQTLESSDNRPTGGDLVIRQASFKYGLSKDLEPLLINIRRHDLSDSYPVRTISRYAGAGFHDSHFGDVPYILSLKPLDQLEVNEVSPFVTSLPEVVPQDFSSVPVWFPGGVLLKQTQLEMKFRIRIPRDTKAEYDLEGKGAVILSEDGIILKRENSDPIVWKNFRIVPNTHEP